MGNAPPSDSCAANLLDRVRQRRESRVQLRLERYVHPPVGTLLVWSGVHHAAIVHHPRANTGHTAGLGRPDSRRGGAGHDDERRDGTSPSPTGLRATLIVAPRRRGDPCGRPDAGRVAAAGRDKPVPYGRCFPDVFPATVYK